MICLAPRLAACEPWRPRPHHAASARGRHLLPHTPQPPLPCYMLVHPLLLGGPRPRRPRARRLSASFSTFASLSFCISSTHDPHRTSLRAGEEGGGVGARGELCDDCLPKSQQSVTRAWRSPTCARQAFVAPNTNMKNVWFGALDRGMCIRAGVARGGWGGLTGRERHAGGKASWGYGPPKAPRQ